MINNTLKWGLVIVVLLSVLLPVGAYFGAVAVFILAVKGRKSRQILLELSKDKPLLLMLFAVLLSIMFSQDKLMSIGSSVMLWLNIGFYLVLLVELKDIKPDRYYKLLNLTCLVACIFGIYQALSGNLNINKSWVDEKTYGSVVRVYSTLLNPNIFAGFLAINLSFAIARFESLRKDILLSVNIAAASVCLLLTYSRGGFLAFLTSMLVLFLIKERKKSIALYLLLMFAVFLIINSAGPASRADIGAVQRDSSSLYRLEIWKASLRMFMDNPIFGNGFGTTWYYLSSGSEKLFRYILHSHNIYLQVASEMGITGLTAFLYIVLKKCWDGYKLLSYKLLSKDEYAVEGFIACMAGIMVHGLIDAVVFVPALSLVFMCYFAMYSRVVSEYDLAVINVLKVPPPVRLDMGLLLERKGAFKLFGGKGAGKDKHEKKEDKAYQA